MQKYKKSLCSFDGNPYSATQIERYQIIDKLKQEYPVSRICKVLEVNRRSYLNLFELLENIYNYYLLFLLFQKIVYEHISYFFLILLDYYYYLLKYLISYHLN